MHFYHPNFIRRKSIYSNKISFKIESTIQKKVFLIYGNSSANTKTATKKKRFSHYRRNHQGASANERTYNRYCQVFIQHTSASLTVNENADPTVRQDFEMYFSKSIPENDPKYIHNYEGADDMPAHLKAALLGSSVLIPVRNGKLALGTWQGIYLCEHRNDGGARNLIITCWGE